MPAMKPTESPNTVHGRLLEAVHISGYTFKRACDELEWLLDKDRWKQIGNGQTKFDDINDFLATLDLSELRQSMEARKGLAKKLEELQASQRATARMLGVSHTTIQRDLDDGTNVPKTTSVEPPEQEDSADDGTDVPEAWFQDDSDPAKVLKTTARRKEKAAKAEEQRAINRNLVDNTPPLKTTEPFPTIVLDPPWDWGDEGDVDQLGRARPQYSTMPLAEIAALDIPALTLPNAHIYLWITNRSLPKGFELLERWGFRYVTCLTWVKRHYGMGNYFRGATEQVLFGVRGSQPILRHDQPTWFEGERGDKHSSKPETFYQIVETCSPGPWRELFGRKQRPGWDVQGAEV